MNGIQEIGDGNEILFTSYVPQGWQTRCGGVDDEVSARTPIVPVVLFTEPNNRAVVRFKGSAGFRHVEPNGFMQQNQADSSLTRYRTFQTAADYCDSVFNETHTGPAYVSVQVQSVQNVELTANRANALNQYRARMAQIAGQNFGVYAEYVEKIYTYTANGTRMRCAVSAMIGALEPKQMAANIGGIFGAVAGIFGKMGNLGNPAKEWERVFELSLDAEYSTFDQRYQDYLQINTTLTPTQGFFNLMNRAQQMVQDSQNYVNGMYMNMANQRMQANQRMAQTINNTQNEIRQMQQQVFQNAEASRDRINRGWNEALREVHSYHTADGPVEVSHRYDHVYQSNENPDLFIGMENGTLDSPFFDELKRRE